MITAFLRTILLYGVLIVGLRLTGKRQIGQLEPIELVLMMLLSDLASVPMQDFGLPLLQGVIPIITLLAISTLLSCISVMSIRFRSLICGEPTVIIRDGIFQQSAMRRSRLTPDEVLEELRAQGISALDSVKYAVLETSGQLSVLLRSDAQPVTPQQMGITVEDDVYLPVIVIDNGRVMGGNLAKLGLDEKWLHRQLKRHDAQRVQDVFLMTVDRGGSVVLAKKEAAR